MSAKRKARSPFSFTKLAGDSAFDSPTWGMARLGFVGLALVVFWLLSFFFYRTSGMSGLGLRYLVIPLIVLVSVFVGGARFIQFAYDLKTSSLAFRYLMAIFLGMNYPVMVISDGKKQLAKNHENLLDLIGGPGYLVVQPGNVVVLENLKGQPRVLGAGRHFVNHLETIKEIASLEELDARVEKVGATTKDGIPVEVKDVHYRYRLMRDPQISSGPAFAPSSLYNFSEEAVLNMAYNRNVNAAEVVSWHFMVNNAIDTALTDYIQKNFVDHLTAPVSQGHDPRAEVYNLIKSGARGRLKERGAELMWIDIGHFDIPNKQVAEQRVSSWQAKWVGDANIVRAYGESQRVTYQELGRAEAQSEMLMSIVHALEDVGDKDNSQQNLRKVMLARIASLLDGMRDQVRESDKDE